LLNVAPTVLVIMVDHIFNGARTEGVWLNN
jgi:hypothetical protein